MKRMVLVVAVLALSTAAFAANEPQAVYIGGTAKLAAGTSGHFDTTQPDNLVFDGSGAKLTIPYTQVESFSQETKMAHPYGVLPIIAVGLVTRLHRLHYVRISYRDDAKVSQVAVFEVPKDVPQVLMPILEARKPKAARSAKPCSWGPCAASPCSATATPCSETHAEAK
jgi:hypothetical protein